MKNQNHKPEDELKRGVTYPTTQIDRDVNSGSPSGEKPSSEKRKRLLIGRIVKKVLPLTKDEKYLVINAISLTISIKDKEFAQAVKRLKEELEEMGDNDIHDSFIAIKKIDKIFGEFK